MVRQPLLTTRIGFSFEEMEGYDPAGEIRTAQKLTSKTVNCLACQSVMAIFVGTAPGGFAPQIVTCAPSSTTRSDGIEKKSVAFAACFVSAT